MSFIDIVEFFQVLGMRAAAGFVSVIVRLHKRKRRARVEFVMV
jgi:putative exporter of polyketide antibiotics